MPTLAAPVAQSLQRALLAWLLAPRLVIVPASAALQCWRVLDPMRETFEQMLLNATLSLAGQLRWQDGTLAFD